MTNTMIGPSAVEVLTLDERTVVGLRDRLSPARMAEFFGRAIPAVSAELGRRGVAPDGPPVAVYRHEAGGEFDVIVGFPVRAAFTATGSLVVEKLPGGRAVRAEHLGPYETLPATYAVLSKWFADKHYFPPAVMWEEYLVGPGAAAEAEYRTRVVFPLD